MSTTFAKRLLADVVHLTLFNRQLLDTDKFYFSEDFIREHTLFLTSNDGYNLWLRASVVQILFSLNQDEKNHLRNFYLYQVPIFKGRSALNGSSSSEEKLTKYLDTLLSDFFDNERLDGLLIDCICDKLEDLTTISEREINKGYITKDELNEIIAWLLD